MFSKGRLTIETDIRAVWLFKDHLTIEKEFRIVIFFCFSLITCIFTFFMVSDCFSRDFGNGIVSNPELKCFDQSLSISRRKFSSILMRSSCEQQELC